MKQCAYDSLPFLDAKSNTFKVDSILLTLTLLMDQNHSWTHSKSCFKKFAHTPFGVVCRFAFPQSTTSVIMVNVNFKIIPQYWSNEYINGYSTVIVATFKCNHDIRCLIGGDGLNLTYYIMKYTTKNQNEFENLVALHLSAFHKWVSQESNLLDNVDFNIKGHQRISSMICSLSFKQEIVVPMACLYLLRGDPFYKFHEFVMLFIKHLLDSLMNVILWRLHL